MWSYEKQGKVLHGTTTIGIACSNGVVLATDTRAIAGTYFIAHKKVRKIIKIDEHLALTIAGGVADAQNVVDVLKYYTNLYRLERKKPMPVKSAARLVSNVFFQSRLFPLIADVLVGGFDKDEGAKVFNVDLFGSLTEEKAVSTGSGSPVAYGIIESEYKDKIDVNKGVEIAVKAVTAAMKRNAGTGDSFDVCIIDENGYRELSDEEKEEILKRISGRS